MATTSPHRIATLDIVRGIAVMGILAMNIVAFAQPAAAYFNPLAYGSARTADLVAYAFNFVLVDGKMRGLFSFLFGASLLLFMQSAERSGEDEGRLVARRQLWLLVFGAIHFYFIWWGDILIGYALAGLVAVLFREKSARSLVSIGGALIAVQLAIFLLTTAYASQLAQAVAAPNPAAADLTAWKELSSDFASPDAAALREILGLYLGPWTRLVRHQFTEMLFDPLYMTLVFGWETLGYMLWGMAALKSGLLTGEWSDRRYVRWAAVLLAVSIPAYIGILAMLSASGFTVTAIFGWSFAATVPFRPMMVVAYACMIIVATRRGGWLTERIAAAGRAAFTNYLGTSILMTGLFNGWGLGLFGRIGRAELYLIVAATWLLMLLWSKPWLERFRYGPLEWLWRSLVRGRRQEFRYLPAS